MRTAICNSMASLVCWIVSSIVSGAMYRSHKGYLKLLPLHDPFMQGSGFVNIPILLLIVVSLSAGCLTSGGEARDWNEKGETHHTMGRYEEAVSAYDRAITIDPGNGEAWRNRGLSLSLLNRSDEAFVSYSRALELDPHDIEALQFIALTRNATGNMTGALQSLDQAVTIIPKSREDAILISQCWNLRGDILTRMNRGKEANESYRRAHETLLSTM
jgi:tetratricopeptide (TPR) repeat protein